MNALILVDLQNDFAPGGALPVPEGDRIIPLVNRLMNSGRFDHVVATQDWHPPSHGSFAANHPGAKPFDMATLGGLPQVLWPIHCVQDTSGADWIPGLDVDRIRRVFKKGTDPDIDSYSGFFDNGRRKATGMGDHLKSLGVKEVYVVGLATDYCVKATSLDAKSLGFEAFVIEDACRGVELQPGDVKRAVKAMGSDGVTVIQSVDVLGAQRSGGRWSSAAEPTSASQERRPPVETPRPSSGVPRAGEEQR